MAADEPRMAGDAQVVQGFGRYSTRGRAGRGTLHEAAGRPSIGSLPART